MDDKRSLEDTIPHNAMLLRILTACLALTVALASPVIPEQESAGHHPEQGAFNICPQLTVRCVAEKDWMHPIGTLGKRRMYSPSFMSRLKLDHWTDRQHSATKVSDVTNATKKATRGTVIESSENVTASAKRMVLFRSRRKRSRGCM